MIYVTGDKHGSLGIKDLGAADFPAGKSLSKNDFVIIAGDFGLIWGESQTPEELYWLDWLNSKPWTTLFVDGNHENFARLLGYPTQDFYGGKASRIHGSVWYLRRGEVFELGGTKCFVMGGAESIDKHMRTKGKSWWPEEIPSEDDLNNALANLEKHNWSVDLVVTHTAPESLRLSAITASGGYGKDPEPTSFMLEDIKRKLSYKLWVFGHFHFNGRIELPFDTRHVGLYNAVFGYEDIICERGI